jgi:hypothetical protein
LQPHLICTLKSQQPLFPRLNAVFLCGFALASLLRTFSRRYDTRRFSEFNSTTKYFVGDTVYRGLAIVEFTDSCLGREGFFLLPSYKPQWMAFQYFLKMNQ